MAIEPAERDLTIVQGDDFSHPFTFYTDTTKKTIINKLSSTFRAHGRVSKSATGTPEITFTINMASAGVGKIVLELPRATTETLTPGQKLFWDLEETDGSNVRTTWLAGVITVLADTTHD